MNNIHVICLKWGTKYSSEYVNNLFAAIRRHSTIPINLYCFTDDANGITIPNIKILPLPENNLEGWWNKLYLFSKDLPIPAGEKIVFFDLDTLVTSNIDDILLFEPNSLVVLRDFYTGLAKSVQGNDNIGSGLMMWTHGNYQYVWDQFIEDPKSAMQEVHPHGDQRWIQKVVEQRTYWQDIFPDRIVSFKVHCRQGLPVQASIVCYHGEPNIPDSITNTTKSWKWILSPAPWVKNHWRT